MTMMAIRTTSVEREHPAVRGTIRCPDEVKMDMLQIMRVLGEVGYDRMVMPGHVPSIPGDPGDYLGGKVTFAFALGYVRELRQTVEAEG